MRHRRSRRQPAFGQISPLKRPFGALAERMADGEVGDHSRLKPAATMFPPIITSVLAQAPDFVSCASMENASPGHCLPALCLTACRCHKAPRGRCMGLDGGTEHHRSGGGRSTYDETMPLSLSDPATSRGAISSLNKAAAELAVACHSSDPKEGRNADGNRADDGECNLPSC